MGRLSRVWNGRWNLRQEPRTKSSAAAAEDLILKTDRSVISGEVLRLAEASGCSACECEFVALAISLDTRLVTDDQEVLDASPVVTVSLENFATWLFMKGDYEPSAQENRGFIANHSDHNLVPQARFQLVESLMHIKQYRDATGLCLRTRSSDRERAYLWLARTPKQAYPVEISRYRRTKPAANKAARIQIRVFKQSLNPGKMP